MTTRHSPGFSYHLQKFKDLAGNQRLSNLLCFVSAGTVYKMQVCVGSLYKKSKSPLKVGALAPQVQAPLPPLYPSGLQT